MWRRGLLLLLPAIFSATTSPLRGETSGAIVEVPAGLQLDLSPAFVQEQEPRLRSLFDAINLDFQGLERVKARLEAGDIELAAEELLLYYVQAERRPPVDLIAPADDHVLELANDVLEGFYTLQKVRSFQHLDPDGNIDWSHQGPHGDKEWAWLLNRHLHFTYLTGAFLRTGEDRYLSAISDQLQDWVVRSPYPDRLTFSAQWRALEAARRILDSWTAVFFQLQPYPAFTAEARILLLASIVDHADALRHHASFWGGNHLLTEKTALALISASWPEFREVPEWLEYSISRTTGEVLAQTYPDGAYKELTNHYQRVVLLNLEQFLRVLRHTGRRVEALELRAEEMWNYFAYVMRPNGDGPLNNASDLEPNRHHLRSVLKDYDRQDWRFLTSSGQEGMAPEGLPSRFFPYAGQAVMRNSWGPESQWAFFDIGPHGSAHQHDDRLHLSVTLGPEDVLVDAGRFNYQPGPLSSYFKGPSSHNIILLNGEGPIPPPLVAREPLAVTAEMTEAYDFFGAQSRFRSKFLTGRSSPQHQRSVFYRRGEYWIVVDHLLAYGLQGEALWHFHPDVDVVPSGGALQATTKGGRHLSLIPAASSPDAPGDWQLVRGREEPPQGWYSRDYNVIIPATAGIYSFPARSPRSLVWLLWPGDPSQLPSFHVEALSPRALRITVGSDVLTLDPLKSELLGFLSGEPVPAE